MISKAAQETARAARLVRSIEENQRARKRLAWIAAITSVVALFGLGLSARAEAATGDTTYRCDDNQTVVVNYSGAGWMKWGGKIWQLTAKGDTQVWRDEANQHLPGVQYEFARKGQGNTYWLTGKNSYETAVLIKPASDDALYCEIEK